MKETTLLIICCFVGVVAGAQSVIRGRVLDISNKPLSAATISLLKADDSSVVKLTLSGPEGKYDFTAVKAGTYRVSVTSVGYEEKYSSVFMAEKSHNYIPDIVLTSRKKTLENVTVKASKPLLEMHLDKFVVNVDASPTNAGLNAFEVIAKSPFVNVDIHENIGLNGKQGVLIMIDGKRTYVSGRELAALLKSIAASNIDKIEIINNPSSKYDAEGIGGIINIKLKRAKVDGWNGSVSTTFRSNMLNIGNKLYVLPNSQNSATFTYKRGKVQFFVSTGFYKSNGKDIGIYNRTFYSATDKYNGASEVSAISSMRNENLPLYASVDYTVNKRNVIGLSTNILLYAQGSQPRHRNTRVRDANNQVNSSFTSHYVDRNVFNKSVYSGYWKRNIDTLGQEFSFDADYVQYRFPSENWLEMRYHTGNVHNGSSFTKSSAHSATQIIAFKGDYLKPIKNGRIEAGFKSSFIKTELNNHFFRLVNNDWKSDMVLDNLYRYHENINAGYLIGYKEMNKWSVQGGLRIEQLIAKGVQRTTNNSLKRNNANLFPTLYTGYQINEDHKLRSSFSRRINRPSFFSLMPYQTFLDSLDVWSGNPNLKPEFSNRIELGYSYGSKYFITLSYTATNDVIRYIVSQVGDRRSSVFYPINIDKFRNLDLSVSALLKPATWWEINLFSDLYFNKYYNLQNASTFNSYVTLNQNINNVFKFSNSLRAELNINYVTKQKDQIFDHNAILNNLSFGLQKRILKEKGSITLNLSDPFGWYRKVYKASFIKMYETGDYRYAARSIGLSLSYHFGKTSFHRHERTAASQEEQNR